MSFTKTYNSMTTLETQVMVYALTECMIDYCVSAKDIARGCSLDIKTVKGVVGSLCKKGLMNAEEDDRGGRVFLDLFPLTPTSEVMCFGGENLEQEDIDATKAWIKENK